MPEVAGGGPAQEKDKSAALTSSPFSPCCRCRAENESLLQSLPPSLTLVFFFFTEMTEREKKVTVIREGEHPYGQRSLFY